jgi:WD40 repeat protein
MEAMSCEACTTGETPTLLCLGRCPRASRRSCAFCANIAVIICDGERCIRPICDDHRWTAADAGHTETVWAVAVTPDGGRAVSASDDDTLKVWELETGRGLHTLAGHTNWVNAVAVTPDGRRAVSASKDTTLKVWELETGRELHTLAGHTETVWAVAVTPDGRRAVSASADQTLKVWELETGASIATFSCDAPTQCCAVLNGWTIVAGDTGGRVHILAVEM